MQFNKLIVLLSLILSLISCKNDAQKISVSKQEIEKTIGQTDFLNKKYFDGYRMSVDESTPSDHPIFSYLDCKKEGYFSVHFIPKNKSLISFWKDKYFEEIKYEYDDMKSANDFISKLLIGKNDLYDIYAYNVEKEYLKSNNGCTIESVYLKNNSFAKIYLYNQESKKWMFKKSINTEILPPYPDTNFFKSNFPEETDGKSIEKRQISSSQEKSEDHITSTDRLSVTEIKNIDISGTWKSHCNNKKSSNLLLIGGSINKNISGTLEIYNNKKDYIAKMMVEFSPDTKALIYIDTSIIGEDIDIETLTSFSKGEKLANIKILDKDTISINWVGLHNMKTNKRLFQQNPFGTKNPFILTKCRD